MRLKLLIERNVRVAGLWIAMREMPSTAEIAAIYPEFGTAFAPTLVGGLLSRCLVVIHDFIRLGTTLGYEVMHNKSVYAAASIRWNAFGNVRSDGIRGMKERGIKKMGFPERKLDGNPITSGSGGALLSHTLSSAVPSPRLALATGFGMGPGVSPGL